MTLAPGDGKKTTLTLEWGKRVGLRQRCCKVSLSSAVRAGSARLDRAKTRPPCGRLAS